MYSGGRLEHYKDITSRKNKQIKLRNSRREYQDLFNGLSDPVPVHDYEGDFLAVNDAAVKEFGYSKDKWLSMNLKEIVAPEGDLKLEKRETEIDSDERLVFESVDVTKDGRKIPVEVSTAKINYHGQKAFLSVIRNIKERKEIENQIKENKEKMELALKGADLSLWDWGLETDGPYYDERWAEMLGYDPDEIDRTYDKFKELLHPEDWDRIMKAHQKHIENEIPYIEIDFRMKTKSGDWKWIEALGKALNKDQKGEPVRIVGINRDITEKKKAQERDKFLHSILRHDVKNRFLIERNYLEELKDTDLTEEQLQLGENALESNIRSRDMIEKIKTLRKVEESETTEEMNLNSVIKEAIKENKSSAETKNINIQYLETNYKVLGSKLLGNLFSNLINNSIRHSKGNKIKITSESLDNQIKITIEDDGIGIPDKIKQKVLNKAFKAGDSKSTGLGFYLVKRITEKYDGKIEIKDSDMG